jgi:uncharacterized lipoprotein YddW (UPF0748 family)
MLHRYLVLLLLFTVSVVGFMGYSLFGHAADEYPISAVNPTEENNPPGQGFPGNRGGDQLILYTPAYRSSTTNTNSFGVELRLEGDRVLENTGFNSVIPKKGVILSGHGKAARWLLQNGNIGARIDTQNGTAKVLDAPDAPNYAFETMKNWALHKPELKKVAAEYTGQPNPKEFEQAIWPSVAPFQQVEPYGVWHRPQVWELPPVAIRATLQRFKDMGMNTVYLETLMHGLPVFPSSTYADYGITPSEYPKKSVFMGQPVLKIWAEEAHKLDMKLVAWVQITYAGNEEVGTKSAILAQYPEWSNRQRIHADDATPHPSNVEPGHLFMDPANPEVRLFVYALLEELATQYPIDGIQLDYIRYPASLERENHAFLDSTWGYTPSARRKFKLLYGKDPITLTPADPLWKRWELFKAEQVDAIVREVRKRQTSTWKAFREEKQWPALELTAAVFPDTGGAYGIKHQNWPQWMRENLLDRITPMVLSPTPQPVCSALEAMKQIKPGFPITPGLFSPYYNSDSYAMLQQLDAAYSCGGAGALWFQSEFLNGPRETALKHRASTS